MIQEIKNINNLNLTSELKEFPNQGVLWEIIEKNQSGKIFELSGGAILIMENCPDPFVFIVGLLTDEAIKDTISLVGNLKFPMVYCHPKYHPLFLRLGWNFHLRTELSLKNLKDTGVPKQHVDIEPIKTLDIFKKCFRYKEQSQLYGSDKNFLMHGTGYALCLGLQVVSEVYASIGGDYAEIGVITHPDYRGKGYGRQIVSHLITQCFNTKITPKWSCNVDNRSSLHTAMKLGFEINRYYTLLVPDRGNVLCSNLANWLKNNSYP
ncbi:GNAT family N-acetyltransferase [Candidatus Tisiphia endosymbiont of Nemotelus uliginosus]|uniref:GNAT family N-acetyltransferase n=1 Tax=Candidatus Tisiphia endosymbiont of Nemotelus uliginosus TaxID=3077926 RepID=UPI0035C8C19E